MLIKLGTLGLRSWIDFNYTKRVSLFLCGFQREYFFIDNYLSSDFSL